MMEMKTCRECGKHCWHNGTGSAKTTGSRCTFCAFPLGTGPKKDKLAQVHATQVIKARKI